MKPPQFDYHAPEALDEALDLLRRHGSDAKVLAGGQSLVPMLNMRLSRPAVLVDVNRIPDLDYIRAENGHLAIGALTRQRTVEQSALVRERCPLLHQAIQWVGHVQIRNRGTVGGSLAHADPAAELPAVLTALDGELVVAGPGGRRRIVRPAEFFLGWFTTSLAPGELLVEVRFPVLPDGAGCAFAEVARRHGDFALCGVAAQVQVGPDGRVSAARLALTGVGPGPVDASAAAAALIGEKPGPGPLEEAALAAAAACAPEDDIHGTADYRRHLARVLSRRALAGALERAISAQGGAGA